MSCYHPLKAFRTPTGVVFQELSRHDIIGQIELPCGQCIGCRMRRATDWTLRVQHEASCWEENCFVTLTYGRNALPPYGSLEHGDFQRFLKRVRKEFHPRVIRYYMCGEYGPVGGRPHYHACLFNLNFLGDRVECGKSKSGAKMYNSPQLEKLWGHGRVTVQDLCRETAGYCARYIMKKILGAAADAAYEVITEDGEIVQKKPEYAAMSLKPGIGAAWFAKYAGDAYPRDYVVADGKKLTPPKYYDKLFKRRKDAREDEMMFKREERGRAAYQDNTPERRIVREKVHIARVSTLRRDLE